MSSRRLLKAAEAIREVVSMAILTELKDPRVRDVTVTYVEVAPDMRSAKVHVSIMGNETRQGLSLRGLQNAAGFLQHQVAEKIDTRYTPRLQFVLDKGVKHSIAVAEILREVLPPEPARSVSSPDESLDDDAVSEETFPSEQLGDASEEFAPDVLDNDNERGDAHDSAADEQTMAEDDDRPGRSEK